MSEKKHEKRQTYNLKFVITSPSRIIHLAFAFSCFVLFKGSTFSNQLCYEAAVLKENKDMN